MSRAGRPRSKVGPPSYTGAHTMLCSSGYVLEKVPLHPAANKRGYVSQHRLVMEAKLGRYLAGTEIVHHKDENKANNHPDNLELLASRAEHQALHNRKRQVSLTEDAVSEALQGRTTREAAYQLGVHHQTLRNHFDRLLCKRKSPSDLDDPQVVETVRAAAADPAVGYRELARRHGIASQTALQVCLRHGIRWVQKSRKGMKRGPRKTATQPA